MEGASPWLGSDSESADDLFWWSHLWRRPWI